MNVLNPSGRPPIVGDVAGFDCSVTRGGWPWAGRHAAEIAARWGEATAVKPDMFDGEVLIATQVEIERARLVSTHSVVRYSALYHWKESGFPHADAFNLFGAGVVVTADGAILLGTMAAHTANAGQTYFPCGTPDPGDIADSKLDIEGSIVRELEEETGLGSEHLRPSASRWISWDGPLFCCARRFDTPLTAAEAGRVVTAHLAAQERPELERVDFVRKLADLDSLVVPAFARSLAAQILD